MFEYNYWPTDHPQRTHTHTHTNVHRFLCREVCCFYCFLFHWLAPSHMSHYHFLSSFVQVLESSDCASLLPSLAQFSHFFILLSLSQPLSKISCPYSLPLFRSPSFFLLPFLFFSLVNIHSKSPGTYKVSSRVTANCVLVRTNIHSWQTSTGGATRSVSFRDITAEDSELISCLTSHIKIFMYSKMDHLDQMDQLTMQTQTQINCSLEASINLCFAISLLISYDVFLIFIHLNSTMTVCVLYRTPLCTFISWCMWQEADSLLKTFSWF